MPLNEVAQPTVPLQISTFSFYCMYRPNLVSDLKFITTPVHPYSSQVVIYKPMFGLADSDKEIKTYNVMNNSIHS